jgi:hypothetical protein
LLTSVKKNDENFGWEGHLAILETWRPLLCFSNSSILHRIFSDCLLKRCVRMPTPTVEELQRDRQHKAQAAILRAFVR